MADDERRMTIVEHLEELRRVIMVSGGAWLLATLVLFLVLRNQMVAFLVHPLKDVLGKGNHLAPTPIVTNVTDTIAIPFKVSAAAGLVVALPVILWQTWGFVAPGLRPVERRFAKPFLVSSVLLFAAGATFAYLVMPLGLNFLAGFLGDNATFLPSLDSYLSFFVILILVFGITFELPVVLVLLGMLGIVSSKWLRRRRKVAIVVIIAVALVITPGADPFTPTALAIPLILLYEASILVLRRLRR